MPARHPLPKEIVEPGIIYVAPPDHHLLLDGKYVVTTTGPKENRFQPSVNALFRWAAYVYGPRVVGIILSGVLNDGTSGMWSVQRMGGQTIIQQPDDAEHPEMPLNVLEYIEVDHTLKAADLIPSQVEHYLHNAVHLPALGLESNARMYHDQLLYGWHNLWACPQN